MRYSALLCSCEENTHACGLMLQNERLCTKRMVKLSLQIWTDFLDRCITDSGVCLVALLLHSTIHAC